LREVFDGAGTEPQERADEPPAFEDVLVRSGHQLQLPGLSLGEGLGKSQPDSVKPSPTNRAPAPEKQLKFAYIGQLKAGGVSALACLRFLSTLPSGDIRAPVATLYTEIHTRARTA
jgi:hypothetical protein